MTSHSSTAANGKFSSLPVSRLIRLGIFGLVLLTASLVAGLQHFVLTLPKTPSGQLQFTDGIIVMTGGQQRLNDGLELLSDGHAGKMLISGVGEGVSRAVLVQELKLDDQQANALFCCVELDFTARDTRGNAVAAQQWADEHGMESLRLVTASYHMPRALKVFARAMPNLDLYQWPVTPSDLQLDNWWQRPAMLRLLTREYAKYLAETLSV